MCPSNCEVNQKFMWLLQPHPAMQLQSAAKNSVGICVDAPVPSKVRVMCVSPVQPLPQSCMIIPVREVVVSTSLDTILCCPYFGDHV